MSIEKDVTEKYINDLERQKQRQKKKKRKNLVILLIVVILLVAAFLLMQYLGLGLGGGKGSGGDEKKSSSVVSTQSSSVKTTETTTTAEEKQFIDVKVSGSTYIYNGQEITLDSFGSFVEAMKPNIVINVIDDNATKNAMDAMIAMLDNSQREHTQTVNEPVLSDSSSLETDTAVTAAPRITAQKETSPNNI